MKKILALSLLSFAVLISYQNCAPGGYGQQLLKSRSLTSLYPYKEKSDYFENVQMVDVISENDLWSYRFIASVVSAEDPIAWIDVEILVRNELGELVCPRLVRTVNFSNNHLQLDNCYSTEKEEQLFITVRARPMNAADFSEISEHEFLVP